MATPKIGDAEILLIADFEIGDEHLDLAMHLAVAPISRAAITISGRSCRWPLRIETPAYTSIRSLGSHLWHIANYLHTNRETVLATQSLGCNLQLNISEYELQDGLSLSASTLKRIGDLNINLVLKPPH